MSVGCHLSISEGIVSAIHATLEMEGSALQIFLSPNRGTSPGKPISDSDAQTIRSILQNTGVYLVVHGKYILNFCSPKVMWYSDALIADLRKANQLGDRVGVVIHQGKNKPEFNLSRSQAIHTYVNHLQNVLKATSDITNPIVLENSCQQGNEIGYTLEELAEIYHTFAPEYQNRVKFCLDTCHIFVAGTLRFSSILEVDQFFEKFDRLIGLDKLEVIHYNDSKTPFDGHNDHHHDLLHGYITSTSYQSDVKKYANTPSDKKGTEAGLKRVVGWAKLLGVPLILETPREESSCQEQIELLNSWYQEADLPDRRVVLPAAQKGEKKMVK